MTELLNDFLIVQRSIRMFCVQLCVWSKDHAIRLNLEPLPVVRIYFDRRERSNEPDNGSKFLLLLLLFYSLHLELQTVLAALLWRGAQGTLDRKRERERNGRKKTE